MTLTRREWRSGKEYIPDPLLNFRRNGILKFEYIDLPRGRYINRHPDHAMRLRGQFPSKLVPVGEHLWPQRKLAGWKIYRLG